MQHKHIFVEENSTSLLTLQGPIRRCTEYNIYSYHIIYSSNFLWWSINWVNFCDLRTLALWCLHSFGESYLKIVHNTLWLVSSNSLESNGYWRALDLGCIFNMWSSRRRQTQSTYYCSRQPTRTSLAICFDIWNRRCLKNKYSFVAKTNNGSVLKIHRWSLRRNDIYFSGTYASYYVNAWKTNAMGRIRPSGWSAYRWLSGRLH